MSVGTSIPQPSVRVSIPFLRDPSILYTATQVYDPPDLAECLGLALDRAAEILREAKR